jgi:RNA polymerase sigma factor (sigma-70 family)
MPLSKETAFAALRRLAALPPDPRPDEELLSKFVADRSDAAFAAIVARHGGLVLDVCRSVLRNEADAEDAFQATFIALANDVRRIRRPAALAGWLHAVAFRTAAKARRGRDRRRLREARIPARSSPGPDPSWLEVRQAIHEEVNRLPERYRAAVVLFYLADRTQDQVAQTLGLSTAGVKKRLERGRALLRSALDRRGFGPLSVLAVTTFSLPVPTTVLARQAAELAIKFVTTRGGVPTAILSLASTGVRPLHPKTVFGVAAFWGVAAAIGVAVLWGGPPIRPPRPGETPPAHADAARERPKDEKPKSEAAKDQLSKPLSPAEGKRVPGFWTHNAGGQITHIEEKWLREKWVLVEFWSSRDGERSKDQVRLEALRKHFLAEDRLLMFSVCVDLELGKWMEYVNSQKDLEGLDGGRVKFFSDKRWWQLSLGVNRKGEVKELIDNYGLQKMPQHFLIRPDETLAVGHIPQDKLKDVLTEHLEKSKAALPDSPPKKR